MIGTASFQSLQPEPARTERLDDFAMQNEFLSDKRARFVEEHLRDQNGTPA